MLTVQGKGKMVSYSSFVENTGYENFSDGSLICRVIENRLIHQFQPEESRIHLIVRRVLQGCAVLGGFGARIPFIRVALDYADGNTPYGIALATGSVVAIGSIVAWCLLKIIDTELSPKFEEERSLERGRLSSGKKTTIKVVIFGVGMLSQAPLAYMAYVYNNNNIAYPIVAVSLDSSLPIYSLNLSAEELLEKKQIVDFEEKLFLLKGKLTSALMEASEETDLTIWQERIQAINEYQARNQGNINTVLSKFLNNQRSERAKESSLVQGGRLVTKFVGVGLTISQLAMYAVLTYYGMKLFTNNEAACYIGAAVVVLANLYLTLKMTVAGAIGGYDTVVNFCKGESKPSRVSIQHPSLQKVLYILSGIACILSFSGPVKVCQDYFSGWGGILMQISSAVGTIVFASLACMNLINEAIEMKMARKGSKEIRQITKIANELRKIKNSIHKSSLMAIAKFAKEISNDVIDQWLKELDITIEKLDAYIEAENSALNPSTPLLKD